MRTHYITVCRYTSRGFSLLELSVVIAIMSVVAVMGLEGAATFAGRTSLSATQEKIRTVDEAIAQFFRVYGRLPCPAKETRSPQQTRYGLEDCSSASLTPPTYGGGIVIGAIPFRTLNLPVSASLDGYNSKLVYVATKNLTVAGTASGTFAHTGGSDADKGMGGIEIRSGKLQQPCSTMCQILADPSTSNGAAYLVLSMGADKRGAYSRIGTVQRDCIPTPTASFDERIDSKNCIYTGGTLGVAGIGTNVFYDSRYNPGTQEANYFDDIIVWRTKGQL